MNLIYVDETCSTNLYLMDLLKVQECEEGTCVRAGFQTAGRGQQGNFWESEAGKNLTFSFVLYPDFLSVTEQFLISQVVALGIRNALSKYADDVMVKWPNDIYWQDKKITGILIENSLIGSQIQYSVSGIGINVNQETFQSNAPNPVSLKQITGRDFDLEQLLKEVMEAIFSLYIKLIKGEKYEIRALYQSVLYRQNGYHDYRDGNGTFRARIDHIEPGGRLILETEAGEKRAYYFKEVAFA